MINLPDFQELMQREVSRKEFLRIVGLALLGVVGVSGLISSLDASLNPKAVSRSKGYGHSPYGR